MDKKTKAMLSTQEKQMVVDLFPFFEDNPVIVDVGSNKGHFADVILEEFKEACTLHLMEPNQKYLDFTEVKYEYMPNVTFSNRAAYKSNGEVTFYYFENYNNELSSLYKDTKDWEGLPMKSKVVKTVKLDDYCVDMPIIDFLKIDVEGAEVDVLLGCLQLIEERRVKFFQVEYSEHYKRASHRFWEVIDLFRETGYKIYQYKDGNFWELKEFTENFEADNFIITQEVINNHSIGWNNAFLISTLGLPKFDLCLEIGAFEGLTTRHICQHMLNDGGRVNVVDPLMDVYIKGDTEHPYFKGQYQRFLRNTRGLPVNLYRGDSEVELPKLNSLRHDFVYIDGNHFPPWPYFDGSWAFAITKVGGYILFDDYTWREETKNSIDKFLAEFGGSLEIVSKDYQVLVKKISDQYNDITFDYYK